MKILHISSEGIRDWEILGGRGVFERNVLPIQAKTHDVKLLTFGKTEKIKEWNVDIIGIPIDRLKPVPYEVVGEFKEENLMALNRLDDYVEETNWLPDIIHVHDADFVEMAIPFAKRKKIPLLYTIHLSAAAGWWFSQTRYQQYLVDWEQRATNDADLIHVCSDYYKNKFWYGEGNPLEYWYSTPKQVRIVPNGVEPKGYDEAGTEVKHDKINIFFAGRFAKGKGIETICEIINEMPDCRFWFAGQFNGTIEQREQYPTTKQLYDLAHEQPLKVRLLGHLQPPSKIGHWAKQMDVWVAPSWHCPFELVGLEAMACQVPLVATKTGAFLEYCNDKNSVLVNPKDKDDLILGIRKAIQQKETLIKGGLETIKNYTWQRTAQGLEEVYNELQI